MKDKVKVSILAHSLWEGGMTRAYLLGQVLQALQHEVEIVGCLPQGERVYPVPPTNLRVSVVSGRSYFDATKKLIERLDGDLIYALKPMPTSFGVALLNKLCSRRPIILDIDDWVMAFFPAKKSQPWPSLDRLIQKPWQKIVALRRRAYRLMNVNHRICLRWMEHLVTRADAITVTTRFLQDRYGGIYLPNGKDVCLFDPRKFDSATSRKRLGLSQYRVLMFAGTPRPHKGLEDILAAIEKLNWPDARLVLVGGRKITDNYVPELLRKWRRWIVQLPAYPPHKIPEVVAAAHVLVVPQRDTPGGRAQMPMKLTDGMAMAKPILSTRVGDIPTIVGDTAYLVDPSCPDQLAERLQWIFENLEKVNFRAIKARDRCIEHYSLDALGLALSSVIGRLT